MRTRKKSGIAVPVVGGSSLLVIFAALSLTVLAMLSLSTARSGAELSRVSAEGTAAYYAADAQAEEILARLRGGETVEGVTSADGETFAYEVPISQTQALSVCVRMADGTWEILRWKTVYTGEWVPDEEIEVWDGEAVMF